MLYLRKPTTVEPPRFTRAPEFARFVEGRQVLVALQHSAFDGREPERLVQNLPHVFGRRV